MLLLLIIRDVSSTPVSSMRTGTLGSSTSASTLSPRMSTFPTSTSTSTVVYLILGLKYMISGSRLLMPAVCCPVKHLSALIAYSYAVCSKSLTFVVDNTQVQESNLLLGS